MSSLPHRLPTDVRRQLLRPNRQSNLVQLRKRLRALAGHVRRRLLSSADFRVGGRHGTDVVEYSELTRPDREVERRNQLRLEHVRAEGGQTLFASFSDALLRLFDVVRGDLELPVVVLGLVAGP